MLMATLALFGRIGLLGAMLMALAVGVMASPAVAFAPDDGATVSASADLPAPCDTDDCTDCGPACAHGCCHGSLVAVTSTQAALPAPFAFTTAPGWTQRTLAPLAAPTGPDRPPRS